MKANTDHIKDLSQLKEKGWNSMSKMLDTEMPAAVPVKGGLLKSWYTKVVAGLLLLSTGFYVGWLARSTQSQIAGPQIAQQETMTVDNLENLASAMHTPAPVVAGNEKTQTIPTYQSERTALSQKGKGGVPLSKPVINTSGVSPGNYPLALSADESQEKATENHLTGVTPSYAAIEDISPSAKGSSGMESVLLQTSGEELITETDATPPIEPIDEKDSGIGSSSISNEPGTGIDSTFGITTSKLLLNASVSTEEASLEIAETLSEANDTISMADTSTTALKETMAKPHDISPKNLITNFKLRGYELAAFGGVSYLRGDERSTRFAYNLTLSKKVFRPFNVGLSLGRIELTQPNMATYHYQGLTYISGNVIGETFNKTTTTTLDQLVINRIRVNQTAFLLSMDVTRHANVHIMVARNKVSAMSFSQTITHTDSSFVYDNDVLVSSIRKRQSFSRHEGDIYSRELPAFNLNRYWSFEMGLRINVTKNIALSGQIGYAAVSPFSNNVKFRLTNDAASQQAVSLIPEIRYIKTGISLYI